MRRILEGNNICDHQVLLTEASSWFVCQSAYGQQHARAYVPFKSLYLELARAGVAPTRIQHLQAV